MGQATYELGCGGAIATPICMRVVCMGPRCGIEPQQANLARTGETSEVSMYIGMYRRISVCIPILLKTA